MTKDFLAKRQYNDKDALPIWDLFNNEGEDMGCLTNFDGEGFVATVKDKTGNTATTAIDGTNSTIRKCLANARKALIDLQAKENLDLLTTEEMTPAQLKRDLKEFVEFHKVECGWSKKTSELHYDVQDKEPRNEMVLMRRDRKKETILDRIAKLELELEGEDD